MKRVIFGMLVAMLAISSLSVAAENTAESSNSVENSSIKVVCTTSILADFARNVLPENVTVEYIAYAGSCPAHFDVKPSDISLVASADVIISSGISPWLSDLLEASGNNNCTIIDCSGLGSWNIPSSAISYVNKIADGLASAFPELNDTISSKKTYYISQINSTAKALKQRIAGYKDRKVVCMQWVKEFVEWLGLNVTYTYGPPERLSTQEALEVAQALQEEGVCAIIDNLQSGTEFGSKLASEAGVSHIVLTNFPGAVPGTDTYLDMLKYNVNQTINGIALFDYKQGEIKELERDMRYLEMQRNAFLAIALMFVILSVILAIMYKMKR